jgi:predicted  nucleic acid-binding Zn-ribbon protein
MRVSAESVGGIDETTVAFDPGVTLLVGQNATNRTSFLNAVRAGFGSDDVSIKGDAETARVDLSVDGETYTRRLRREGGQTVVSGDAYPGDPEAADLFAFLLGSNEARQTVVTEGNLRDVIVRPVDVGAIETEIDERVETRESLREELAEIAERKGDLPRLERRRSELRETIDDTRAELEAVEAEIDGTDVDVERRRAEQSELEERLEKLRQRRSELEDVRYDLETEREGRETLLEEREELERELAELPASPGTEDDVSGELSRLRGEKQRLETELDELQSAIRFNEDLLDGPAPSAFTADGADAVTDRLVDDDVRCWTCGSTVAREQIRSTVERLRELSRSTAGDVDDLQAEIDELESTRNEHERVRRERERLERRLSTVETEIQQVEDRIERLEERRADLTDAVETAETAVEALETADDAFDDVLDLHKQANDLEYELGRLETELESVDDEIGEIESRIADEDGLETRLDEVTTEIESLRTKIDRVELDAVDRFNEHATEVLELLEYDNVARLWLERVERDERSGRADTAGGAFELHVVRTSANGTAYEDTVDHLSESEREVAGLVFALAGYLAHRVFERVPVMLLDSLEAIDAERIAALVDHFAEYATYLLVALLPEDAAVLPERYDRITEI